MIVWIYQHQRFRHLWRSSLTCARRIALYCTVPVCANQFEQRSEGAACPWLPSKAVVVGCRLGARRRCVSHVAKRRGLRLAHGTCKKKIKRISPRRKIFLNLTKYASEGGGPLEVHAYPYISDVIEGCRRFPGGSAVPHRHTRQRLAGVFFPDSVDTSPAACESIMQSCIARLAFFKKKGPCHSDTTGLCIVGGSGGGRDEQ